MWIERARESTAGRHVVVTGASSGIGCRFAERIAAPGTSLTLVARRRPLLDDLAVSLEASGAKVLVQAVDLRGHEAGAAAAREAVERFGAPALVVAAAGHSVRRDVLGCAARPDTVTRLTAVNHVGAVAHLLPCIEAMAASGAGTVVGVTSANARLAVPGWGAYASSKGAFDLWLAAARPELEPQGVRVSAVALPLVATDMVEARRRHRGMPVDRAVEWLARAAVTAPARVAPWWLRPAEAAQALAPGLVPRIIGRWSHG